MKQNPAGYSGTPLPKKLGIKPGMTVSVIRAPSGFAEILGELPEGAKLRSGARRPGGLVIWFVKSTDELGSEMRRVVGFTAGAPLWIAWRKKRAQPSENAVRDAGLAAGLVDYKVCAIDATWSGLLFAPRRNESAT